MESWANVSAASASTTTTAAAPAPEPVSPRTFVVCFDTETSGFGPMLARIIQIAACAFTLEQCTSARGGLRTLARVPREFSSIARPDTPSHNGDESAGRDSWTRMHSAAVKVHGIKSSDVERARPLSSVIREFAEWLGAQCRDDPQIDTVVLAGHNAFTFDNPVLFCELERLDMHPGVLVPRHLHTSLLFVDTLVAWRTAMPQWSTQLASASSVPVALSKNGKSSLKLNDLHVHVTGRAIDNAHSALGDARALATLLLGTRPSERIDAHPYALALQQACTFGEMIERFENRKDREKARPGGRLAEVEAPPRAACGRAASLARTLERARERWVPQAAATAATLEAAVSAATPRAGAAIVTSPYFSPKKRMYEKISLE